MSTHLLIGAHPIWLTVHLHEHAVSQTTALDGALPARPDTIMCGAYRVVYMHLLGLTRLHIAALGFISSSKLYCLCYP